MQGNSSSARIVAGVAGALVVSVTALAGCQSEKAENSAQISKPGARISAFPENGADVDADQSVRVTASKGTLSKIVVRDPKGRKVAGGSDALKVAWASDQALAPNTKYRIEAEARDADGRATKIEQEFKTKPVKNTLSVKIEPAGETVGVGMPIVATFNRDVPNRAAVERRMIVQTSKPVVGRWYWFSNKEAHYRPKSYWPAYTSISVKSYFQGQKLGKNLWGAGDRTTSFKTGRSVVTIADLYDHQARVYINGKLERSIPITGGKPGWRTRNGIKVILERRTGIRFTNQQIGAPESYSLWSAYGLRTTWTGEFVHSAPWSSGSHGYSNVSHGCIGMSTSSSRWLWSVSQIGDPIDVRSSGDDMDVRGNGYGDWNIPWSKWQKGSALNWV